MLRLSSTYSVKDATKWLSNHGLSVSGTKPELNNRIRLYKRYPKLVEKLHRRNTHNRTFPCALDEATIPPLSAAWIADQSSWPNVSEAMFLRYCAQKREGSIGQQAKAVRMLESRKIVNVKTLKVGTTDIFVRALINPSFGSSTRPAVLLFRNSMPFKGYCECPVGPSGICCHILALMLFLKHYWETGVELLELTCTQQLQKWHKRCRKGSVPMLPLAQLKVKAAKIQKARSGGVPSMSPADPDKTYFKRNVPNLIKNTAIRIAETNIPVTDHFYSVLSKSNIGRQSAFGEHLCFMYSARSLQHHDYSDSLVPPPNFTVIHRPSSLSEVSTIVMTSDISPSAIVEQNELPLSISNSPLGMYCTEDCTKLEMEIKAKLTRNSAIIELDLSNLKAPKPFGANYVHCMQQSDIWHAIRKNKVTGSRLPALLGLYGKSKYEHYWGVVKEGTPEIDLSHILNVQRGIIYEDEAILHFEQLSRSVSEKVGFFMHPTNVNFGASPDAVCASGLILEIKTRAVNSVGPLDSLKDCPNYFVQCQLQMACTNAHSCVLLSYHPETKSGNSFIIQRNRQLMNIIIEIINCIMNDANIKEWHHLEPNKLAKVGEAIIHKQICFENLKPFRAYLKSLCKVIPLVQFISDVDFITYANA